MLVPPCGKKFSLDPGMRKTDLCFYKFALDEIKAKPPSVVFIDDRPDNILAARPLGINDIVSPREPVQLESESTRGNIIEKALHTCSFWKLLKTSRDQSSFFSSSELQLASFPSDCFLLENSSITPTTPVPGTSSEAI
jgi:hypothetical protein